jgi:hypothetical protein
MKIICLIALAICIFLVGCTRLFKSDNVKEFIPGTYVSEWTSEFAESRDTLQIQLLTGSGSEQYQITRRTYHQYNQQTKPVKPQYKIVRWTGSFDENEKVIVVTKNGRILSFDPKNNELKMGVTKYRKL